MANGKWKMENGEARRRKGSHCRLIAALITFAIFLFPFSMPAFAGPTQEDVFKSINENVGASADGGKLLAFLAAGVGVAIILVLFNRRQTRAAVPQPLNHQGKLLREIIKTTGMRPEDGRRLKALADQMGDAGTPLESPVTLLLCPSLLKKARGRNDE